LGAITQINAVAPAPDNDNHASDNLARQDDEQREQEPTLTDESSEPLLDYMPSIMPSDHVDDTDFKEIYRFVLDGTFDGVRKLFAVCYLLENSTL